MITMNDIIRDGHPILREKADEVALPPSTEDVQLLNDMITFVKNSQDEELAEKYKLRSGVGIAAPQLGISKRLIAVHFEDFNGKLYSHTLINPRIVSHSIGKAYLAGGEGCLSVDRNIEGYVVRYARITVKALDIDGKPLQLRLKDYAAIVMQHEIDHLNGIMFYDHINKENPFFVPENTKAIE